ncbi:tRNA (adenosine(37)-N6)-threonylcarbamoyltransferase complex ATPase subunit type 1 TsaE [Synechococcus sp. BSF8S]|uniref:tRNA (adenosine(37)-N6)-threonylcarbamoyltransferase complex ATPase subunit type 1 TsaE n=1 Tax=Synechococcales TaxID=1890424 RepID=UPI0016246266|nr:MULTISPECIES: tRNA (adenosine(37)-N6)-threonylcarbamoyltransferase complex ATPase subunit type 1 TsaE [unclassified Synechococcus]MBC1261171.1 tRNA (adenosine(37)-N6)-threonylcarbamoyltransferase complex ATPase subunit type 1 TsaE [Synechococcus sp. BSF8S]MBC1264074.1 tRNA (adenosine(37)-N6)-threonylcarbamoyltransferase complex ATPase subunit type 1 TsaE [Synechococcus sp. BSA11S]
MGELIGCGQGWRRRLSDAAATRALGADLAERLLEQGPRLLLLEGDLGAGKTCLVQGLAQGLGISEPITSPTFALAQHYAGRRAGRTTDLVHLDLYRLEQPASAEELFAQEEEEALALGAVLAVEWPERLRFSPAPAWRVHLAAEGEGRFALVQEPEGVSSTAARKAIT